MLCPSCDAVRFPPKQHSEDTGRRANATATLRTARKVITDSVKVNNELIRGPRSDDKHVDTSTTTEQKHDDDDLCRLSKMSRIYNCCHRVY